MASIPDTWPQPQGTTSLLAQNWWAVLLRGVFAILFGLIALLMPGVTIASLVLLFGAYMIVDGIFAIISGLRGAAHHGRWGMLILEGVIDLIAGLIAFFAPIITALAFVYLCGIWAIVSGVMLLMADFRLHPAHGRWLMGLGAICSIIWGILLFLWPVTGAVVMTWWLGAYALVFGCSLIGLSFRLRRLHTGTGSGTGAAATA